MNPDWDTIRPGAMISNSVNSTVWVFIEHLPNGREGTMVIRDCTGYCSLGYATYHREAYEALDWAITYPEEVE